MSSGNGYASSSIANIALPPQSRETSAAAASTSAQIGSLITGSLLQQQQPQPQPDYSSPEYQQYYQQYYQAQQQQYSQYNQALYQQQYAAYYQQQAQQQQMAVADANTAYQTALYGQAQPTASPYLVTNGGGAYPLANSVAAAAAALAAASNASASTTPGQDNGDGGGGGEVGDDDDDDDPTIAKNQGPKAANSLPYHCNAKMGLNPLIYTNIQQSPYFKNNLFQLKTYHELVDEIYYNVKHLEPWEKGSRKLSGQTGMCGSVRGVGAGGIISTPFCILFKLYTLRPTRKQIKEMIRHKDSPFIRGLGFMFIRYTQPPQDLWKWFEPFLADDEEVDPKAGGGLAMTIGEMVRLLITKADWFGTLFPRIPIPVQKEIDESLLAYDEENPNNPCRGRGGGGGGGGDHSNGGSYSGGKSQRSESKYSSKYGGGGGHGSRSRSRTPPSSSRHHSDSNKPSRSTKYDDDRRSNRKHRDRY